MYVSKDVIIRGYFSMPKGVREQTFVKHWYKQLVTLYFSRVLHCLHQNEVRTRMTKTPEQHLHYVMFTTYRHKNNTYKNTLRA
jgi:hypothetical protein